LLCGIKFDIIKKPSSAGEQLGEATIKNPKSATYPVVTVASENSQI